MSPIRKIARPLLASMFIAGGIDALRHPADKVAQAEKAGLSDAAKLVRIQAGTDVVAGLALATGRLPRLASLTLVGTLVPTTYVGHPFWAEKDKAAKTVQRTEFLKNLGILGGLLVSVADTGGRESVTHAAARVTNENKKKVSKAAKKANKSAGKASAKAQKKASKNAGKVAGTVSAKLPG